LEDNIKIGLVDLGSEDVKWIHLAQDEVQRWALANTDMNLWVPQKRGISSPSE
jgi:hypothetical protein